MDSNLKPAGPTPWGEDHEPASSSPPVRRPIITPSALQPADSPTGTAPQRAASELPFPVVKSEPSPVQPEAASAEEPPQGPGEGSTAETKPYSDEDFEKERETLAQDGATTLGIVGGKGVGKTFLFQAMVYRTYDSSQSGALSSYLDGIRLFRAVKRQDSAQRMNLARFVKRYEGWGRLPQTKLDFQEWYRLCLRYRTGIMGRRRSSLDVEFFDTSGEHIAQTWTSATRVLWREATLNAQVMVFCLPLWAAFPGDVLAPEDWDRRQQYLEEFEQVVLNYTEMREASKQDHPVSSILALTQADDRRSGLRTLYNRWIRPYMESPYPYLRQLRRGGGAARYLANARKVSAAVHEEFAAARDRKVGAIPRSLDFGRGKPWLIPVSAVDGDVLDRLDPEGDGDAKVPDRPERKPAAVSGPLAPPVPVHVELPLLVALCERSNALM